MTQSGAPMLIDGFMPRYDVSIAAHTIVHRDPVVTFGAAAELDFMTVHSPLLDLAMWARGVPGRITGHALAPPARLVLAKGDPLPGWLVLGQRDDQELAFGAVGKFWQPSIEWRDVPAERFATFDEPGWGKIAANFSVMPYGEDSTLLTYECRTVITDDNSRRKFMRYWRLGRPVIAHIFRATVNTIRANAEQHSAPTGHATEHA
jgi:hypothetical protein